MRSVTNARAASTERPFGPGQSGLSKNVTRRFVAADSTVDAAMWRRTASPANPTVMPIFDAEIFEQLQGPLDHAAAADGGEAVGQLGVAADAHALASGQDQRTRHHASRRSLLARPASVTNYPARAGRGTLRQPLRWRLPVTAANA